MTDFFPPIALPLDSNLREVFNDSASTDQAEKLVEVIPHVNHDQLVQLALYLAFEAKLNDEQVWRALEDACLTSLHLFSLH